MIRGKITEAELQAAVIDLARVYGWRVFHPRTVRTAAGRHMTALQGDAGYPDLTLAHARYGVIFAELKSERGTLADHQALWLDALEAGGAAVYVWRPVDWFAGRIHHVLRGSQ